MTENAACWTKSGLGPNDCEEKRGRAKHDHRKRQSNPGTNVAGDREINPPDTTSLRDEQTAALKSLNEGVGVVEMEERLMRCEDRLEFVQVFSVDPRRQLDASARENAEDACHKVGHAQRPARRAFMSRDCASE